MKAKLIGLSEVDFKNPEGVHIQGNNIFVSYASKNVLGERCDKFFIPDSINIPEDIQIGCMLALSFNPKGKIDGIAITK